MITNSNGTRAWIGRSSRACDHSKWIICVQFDNMIESDQLGARRGLFTTKRAAVEAFENL